MYGDDSDLCLRIRRAGYELVMAEDTCVLHKEGASSPKRSSLIDRYSTTSSIRLLRRQAPFPILAILIYLSLRLGNRMVRRDRSTLAVWEGIKVYVRERRLAFTDRL
jgi:hypothetical protein